MKNKLFSFTTCGCFALAFTACGDDVTNVTENSVGVQSYESFKELPECTKENVGEMALSKENGKLYYCVDSAWVQMVAEVEQNANDGKDGENGTDGSDGENGKDGVNGKDGTSCSLSDKGDGFVSITCGDNTSKLVKAFCGAKPYDPELKFCLNDEAYVLCDGKTYDPTAKFCFAKELYDLCGGEEYEPTTEFCLEGSKHELCGGETYDPTVVNCVDNELYKLCGTTAYKESEKFCFEDELFDYCDGKTYNGKLLECENGKFTFTDDRNGGNQKYNVVSIGEQVWMAENLNFRVVINNEVTPADSGSYCYGDGDEETTDRGASNCEELGRLYTWDAAQNACPTGWHLPSVTEWNTLESFIIDDQNIDEKDVAEYLRVTDWRYKTVGTYSKDEYGKDTYGFSAIKSGRRYNGEFEHIELGAHYWSATPDSDNRAFGIYIHNYNEFDDLHKVATLKSTGFSVRCVMDSE